METRELIAVACGVGITASAGYLLYKHYKRGGTPTLVESLTIPVLTGIMIYTISTPTPTAEGILRAGRLLPPALGG